MSHLLGLQAFQLAVLTQVGCIATVDLFLASIYLVLPLERCRISLTAFYTLNKEGSFLHEINQSSFVLSVLPSPAEIRGSASSYFENRQRTKPIYPIQPNHFLQWMNLLASIAMIYRKQAGGRMLTKLQYMFILPREDNFP